MLKMGFNVAAIKLQVSAERTVGNIISMHFIYQGYKTIPNVFLMQANCRCLQYNFG